MKQFIDVTLVRSAADLLASDVFVGQLAGGGVGSTFQTSADQLAEFAGHIFGALQRRYFVPAGDDAQTRLQAALGAIEAAGGGTLVLQSNATYDLGTATNSDTPFLSISHTSGIVIEMNNALVTATVEGSQGHKPAAFYFENCANVLAVNGRFKDLGYQWDAVLSGGTAPVRGLEAFTFGVEGLAGEVFENVSIVNCYFEDMATCVQFQNNDGTTARHHHIRVIGCAAKNCAYGYGGYFNGNDVYIEMTNQDVRRSIIMIGAQRVRFDVLCHIDTTNLTLGQISMTASSLLPGGDLKDISGRLKISGYVNTPPISIQSQTDGATNVDMHNIDIYVDATGLTVQPSSIAAITCYEENGSGGYDEVPGPSPNVDFDNICLDGSTSTQTGPHRPLVVTAWTDRPTWDTPGKLVLRGCFSGEGVAAFRTAIPGFMGYVNGQVLVVTSEDAVQLSTHPLDVSLNKYTGSTFALEVEVYAANADEAGTGAQTWARFIVIGHKPGSGPCVLTTNWADTPRFATTDAGITLSMTGAPDHHFRVTFPNYTGANGYASVKCRPLAMLAA